MLSLAKRVDHSFRDLLAAELAPREGRWAVVTRIVTGCVITVTIAMVFQIPEPTYMAYIVFLISKDGRTATVTSALGGLTAVTLAIVLTLGLSLIDTAEPALRLPCMAIATFLAMFTSRTFVLGPISYLAGFVIVLLQSLVDDVPSPEGILRATLWTWVIIFVPVAVTVIVNLVFARGSARLIERTVRKLLMQSAAALARNEYRGCLREWRARLLPLLAMVGEDADKASVRAINAPNISALLNVLVILESFPIDLPDNLRTELAEEMLACLRWLEGHALARSLNPSADIPSSHPDLPPAVVAFRDALARFQGAPGIIPASPKVSAAPESKQTFLVDTYSNPAYWQFAFKTTIAVMGSYVIYTLLDWPGLRTAIVTCFFVALSSLGETVHKLLLRLSGAIIGGLIAGICIVFVLPHLTDIGELCLLIGGVSVGAAWVATSSELLSYAGMQIAFAFFLGILQGYAPAADLTVLRDRVVGILLGNILITIIFSTMWPESAKTSLRIAIAEALRAISALMRRDSDVSSARLRVARALVRADQFRALSVFELRMLSDDALISRHLPDVAAIEQLAGAAFVVKSESIASRIEPGNTAIFAQWAGSAADGILQNAPLPPAPPLLSASVHAIDDSRQRMAERAINELEREVRRVSPALV